MSIVDRDKRLLTGYQIVNDRVIRSVKKIKTKVDENGKSIPATFEVCEAQSFVVGGLWTLFTILGNL